MLKYEKKKKEKKKKRKKRVSSYANALINNKLGFVPLVSPTASQNR